MRDAFLTGLILGLIAGASPFFFSSSSKAVAECQYETAKLVIPITDRMVADQRQFDLMSACVSAKGFVRDDKAILADMNTGRSTHDLGIPYVAKYWRRDWGRLTP